jgi:hypothetical protein
MPLSYPYVSVDEVFGDRTGVPFNAFGPRQYTRRFRVVVADKAAGEVAVCYAPGIPRPFALYFNSEQTEWDPFALLIRLSATEENKDDWQSWIVTCEYSTEAPPNGQPDAPGYPSLGTGAAGGAANNPELQPPNVGWDYHEQARVFEKDLDKKVVVNSANQRFTPVPTVESGYYVLTIERNELKFDRVKAEKYAWSLNVTDFLGAKKGQVQCYPPIARQQYLGTMKYFRTTYRLRFVPPDKEAWQPEILDQGLCKIEQDKNSPNFGRPVPIIRGPHKVTQPVLLNGKGDEGDIIIRPFGVFEPVPVYLKFKAFKYEDFAKLLEGGVGG